MFIHTTLNYINIGGVYGGILKWMDMYQHNMI